MGVQQPSFGRMGTAIWSPGGVMGVRQHSMYHRCLQLARWRMEPILCGGKGVFAQPPHSAHLWAPFVILSISFFYFSCINISPPSDGGGKSTKKQLCQHQFEIWCDNNFLASYIARQHNFNSWWENLHAMINCLTKIFCKTSTSTSIVPKDTTDKKYVAMTGVWIFIHWNCSNKWCRH